LPREHGAGSFDVVDLFLLLAAGLGVMRCFGAIWPARCRQRHAADPTGEHPLLTNPETGTETGEAAREFVSLFWYF
jgi:hypothetical protein